MRLLVLICLSVLLLFFTASTAHPGGLFVSGRGSDNADGRTASTAFATIQRAASRARAGDTVYVARGTYAETITPVHPGGACGPVVFRSIEAQRCTLTAPGATVLKCTGLSDLVFDGFVFLNHARAASFVRCERITLRNCVIRGSTSYRSVSFEASSQCVIEGNLIDKEYREGDGIVLNPVYSEGLGSSLNLIRNNTVVRCGHVGIITRRYARFNVIRENELFLNHTGISVQEGPGTYRSALVEGNVLRWNGVICYSDVGGRQVAALGNGHAAQFCGGTDVVVRYNVFCDDTAAFPSQGDPADPRFHRWSDLVSIGAFDRTDMIRPRFYHNTLHGATDQEGFLKTVLLIDDIYPSVRCSGVKIANSIFLRSSAPWLVVDKSLERRLEENENRYSGNLFWAGDGGPVQVRYYAAGSRPVWTLAEACAFAPKNWLASNTQADPGFVAPVLDGGSEGGGPVDGLRPRAGSAACDAAVPLARATAEGVESMTLKLDDAGWFTDGWGVVDPDSLLIEPPPQSHAGMLPVGIRSIDHRRNTVTLTSPRTWARSAGVWYFRSDRVRGARPDIGALESDDAAFAARSDVLPGGTGSGKGDAGGRGSCEGAHRTQSRQPEAEREGVRGAGYGSSPLSAHPNPFNPSTTIRLEVREPSIVSLVIYSLAGEKVRVLLSGSLERGVREAAWDGMDERGRHAATGLYICRALVVPLGEGAPARAEALRLYLLR
jgi:hypothetical protein